VNDQRVLINFFSSKKSDNCDSLSEKLIYKKFNPQLITLDHFKSFDAIIFNFCPNAYDGLNFIGEFDEIDLRFSAHVTNYHDF
jgi:hypothetical protein